MSHQQKSDHRIQLSTAIIKASKQTAIVIAEVGARIIDEGQVTGEAAEIFHNLPQAKILAFEPDQHCCDQINNMPDHFAASISAFPYALGKEKKQQTLYITNHGMCSSLYKPNETFMQHFAGLEVAYLKKEVPMDVISLDEFMKVESIDAIDFIKIDVQGAELDVFQGGEQALNDVIGICTEVEFSELYKEQPLFGDVDRFLRKHGFQLHHFIGLGSRSLKNCNLPHIPQALWADALYLPSFERIDTLSSSQLIKLAVMASLYEVYDMAEYALQRYDVKENTKMTDLFHQFFTASYQAETPPISPTTNTTTTLHLPITGGIQITVPNNLQLMTPYILTEQQDWFEDEIKFIRKFIKNGAKALDIGANFGCYTTTLARLVGKKGHVWAFEPASTTASYLKKTIEKNNFKNITLTKAALSNHTGTAELSLDDNSELNSIAAQSRSGRSESVPLKTLDDCIKSYQWRDISFVKLDAEGEEIHILEGGKQFFSQFSPLVMFELKHGDQVNEGLIEKFMEMDYQIYALIPGLDVLAPFNQTEEPDAYLLNLFACKQTTAKELALAHVLIEIRKEQGCSPSHDWSEIITAYPYVQRFHETWESTLKNKPEPNWDTYEQALNHYASAHLETLPDKKLSHLEQAFMTLASLLDVHATIPRILTLIRIAIELGKRATAVQLLNQVSEHLIQEGGCTLNEPFLPISNLAETCDPEDNAGNWCLATVLAETEKKQAFSSYFSGQSSQEAIEHFFKLGFQDDDMQRRLQLIQQRFSS